MIKSGGPKTKNLLCSAQICTDDETCMSQKIKDMYTFAYGTVNTWTFDWKQPTMSLTFLSRPSAEPFRLGSTTNLGPKSCIWWCLLSPLSWNQKPEWTESKGEWPFWWTNNYKFIASVIEAIFIKNLDQKRSSYWCESKCKFYRIQSLEEEKKNTKLKI